LIAFNDNFPNNTYIPGGAHAKGFMSWDSAEQVLLYLMHSVPRYPNVTEAGKILPNFNKNAYVYG